MGHNSRRRNRYNKNPLDYVILESFRRLAQEPILLALLTLYFLVALAGIVIFSHRLQSIATVVLPDLRFMGYSKAQLYSEFYHVLGRDGCAIYSALALWDVAVFLPAYALGLGTAWVHLARRTYDRVSSSSSSGYWNADRGAYWVLPIALCDLVETLVQRHGCTLLLSSSSNQELSKGIVRVASAAVSIKWALLLFFLVSMLDRVYKGFFVRRSELPLFL